MNETGVVDTYLYASCIALHVVAVALSPGRNVNEENHVNRQREDTCRQRSVNKQTPEVSALFKRAVSVLSALCQRALDGD